MKKSLVLAPLLVLLVHLLSVPSASAHTARHCQLAEWKHNHWVCLSFHKDPPPLITHPSKIHERDGLPANFNVTGTGLEPRTFYEFLSDLPFACDYVEVDGWFLDPITGLPEFQRLVIFNRFPGLYGGTLTLVPLQTFVFADVGGNVSFTVNVDGCVKRVYNIHLVSLSPQATEFSVKENISVP